MAARTPRKKKSSTSEAKRPRKRAPSPALGNDPFERGAAVRPPKAPVRAVEPSVVVDAEHREVSVPPGPMPATGEALVSGVASADLDSKRGPEAIGAESAALDLDASRAGAEPPPQRLDGAEAAAEPAGVGDAPEAAPEVPERAEASLERAEAPTASSSTASEAPAAREEAFSPPFVAAVPSSRPPEPRRSTPPGSPVAAALSTATELAASLRSGLDAIESRVETAAAVASSRLTELARKEASGELARDVLQALASLLPALRAGAESVASLAALVGGGRDRDRFGMDRELSSRAAPLLDLLYSAWWRVEARGIENVPDAGPTVVVANHGGVLAWDALVLRHALLRHHPLRRELRPLLDEHALALPVAGSLAVRLGAVPATPANALALLGQGLAIGVFPEGSRSARRPWASRYRIERFGRGGFAKLAMRTNATIVPCAIVGSEETSAPFARPGWLGETLGLPTLDAAAALLLSPLGTIPLPSRWSLRFGAPIAAGDANAAEDPARALELTERCRAALQAMLDEDVAARRSVYL